MKILMFLDNNFTHDSRVLRETTTLANAGYDLRLLAVGEGNLPAKEYKDGYAILRPAVRRTATKSSHFRFLHALAYWLNYYLKAFQETVRHPANVYHCHDLLTLPAGFVARVFTGGKLIYDSHELFTEQALIKGIKKYIYKLLERCLIGSAYKVITVNEFIAQEISRRYSVAAPLVLLNCPSAVSEFSQTTLKPYDTSSHQGLPIVLYTGGYMEGRGLSNLILSTKHIQKGQVIFLGFGKMEAKLKELVHSEKVDGRVTFLPPVPPGDLVSYIRTASLGVILFEPVDLNNYYASPNKLFEYIHAGLPVVCSDLPFLRKIVDGYGIGRLCNSSAPEDIAAAINWILEDENRYHELKSNLKKAAAELNWENESQKLIALYKELGAKVQ